MIDDAWFTIAIGVGTPLSVTVIQMWLKFASRTRASPGDPWRSLFTRDDFAWWVEWVVTAVVALSAFLLRALAQIEAAAGDSELTFSDAANESLSGRFLLLMFVTLGGMSFLPVLVSRFGYDYLPTQPDSDTLSPTLRIVRGIVLPNSVGIVILVAVVIAGLGGGGRP